MEVGQGVLVPADGPRVRVFRGCVARPCLRAPLLLAELSKVPTVPASVSEALAPATFALHQLLFLLLPRPGVRWASGEAQQSPETTDLSFPAMKSVLSLSFRGTFYLLRSPVCESGHRHSYDTCPSPRMSQLPRKWKWNRKRMLPRRGHRFCPQKREMTRRG